MLKCRGVTLIEFLVVINIIIILTGIVFINYRAGERQLTLQRAANKLAQDIRRAQEMAMSARECQECGGGVPEGGYGACFNKNQTLNYQIYADTTSPWGRCDPNDQIVETISLERGVEINTTALPDIISVNFKPPDPTIEIKDNNATPYDELTITLQLTADTSKTRTILVNKAGRIEVQ